MKPCPKTNNPVDYALCPKLCDKKCDVITVNGKGREVGQMLRNIVKHCAKRHKINRPFEDRRAK